MSKRKKLFLVLTTLSALYFVCTHFLLNLAFRPGQPQYMTHNEYMWWISSTVVAALLAVYSYFMYDDAY